ncbi:MAG: hypothetical protein ABIO67_05480, partial [Mycobacteriales bacterium]
ALGLGVLVAPAQAAPTTGGQSTYVPQDPVRILDTREGLGAPHAQVGPGGTLDLVVAGTNGVPATATAVVLNVTATRTRSATDIRVYPTPVDASFPDVSNLNAAAGGTVANLVTVPVGRGGAVRLRSSGGPVDLIADLQGYFSLGAGGASYTGQTPKRLLDTRDSKTPLQAGIPRALLVRGGTSGVPGSATAVTLNVTAVTPSDGTDIRVYPTRIGGSPPLVSNLNPPAGRTTAAAVVVPVGDDGTVQLLSSRGTVNVVVDVSGYYAAGSDADVFHPLPPRRLLDTRTASAPLGSGQIRELVISGTGQVPHSARAVVLNVTAVGPSAGTDLNVYPRPADASYPTASNLNVVRGQTAANTVVTAVGREGAIRVRNANGTVHLVVDLAGWYGPAGDGWDISWPQCTAKDSPVSRHPDGGAFAVIGLTRGRPFTDNECFADEWTWASSLPGKPAVYINADAPGASAGSNWTTGPRASVCDGTSSDPDCGWNYGDNLASYAVARLSALPERPQVFLDVEGPYSSGPVWQANAGVNGNVVIAAINRLRQSGYRVGIYSNGKDWSRIVGGLKLPLVQNWTFPHSDDPWGPCTPGSSFSGGDVVMRQYQVSTDTLVYDRNHTC